MAQSHGILKIPFLCGCCLLALIFTAGHVNPTDLSPYQERQFALNGKHPNFPNIYPLSVDQWKAGVDQTIMTRRIEAQNGKWNKGLGFYPELQAIVQGLKNLLPNLYGQYMSKSWPQLLRDLMDEEFRNTEADNTDLLLEILVTTTNAQKDQIGLYSFDLCDRIFAHQTLKTTKNPGCLTLLKQLCKVRHAETYDDTLCLLDIPSDTANAIHKYLIKMEKGENNLPHQNQEEAEENMGRLLAQTSYTELRCVFRKLHFGESAKLTIGKILEGMMLTDKNEENHILQAIYAIHMDAVQGRPEFLFHLFEKIWKKQKNDKDLNAFLRDFGRLLITHAQIDLVDIGSTKLNKLMNWLKSVDWHLEPVQVQNVGMMQQQLQVDAFIKIVELVTEENWLKHDKQ